MTPLMSSWFIYADCIYATVCRYIKFDNRLTGARFGENRSEICPS